MIRINQIKIKNQGKQKDYHNGSIETKELEKQLTGVSARLLKTDPSQIRSLHVVRHSIDARKKPEIYDIYVADIELKNGNEEEVIRRSHNHQAVVVRPAVYHFPQSGILEMKHRPVVIGAGPAGLFCAYQLAMHGYRPVLLERGRDVEQRQADVAKFWETGVLDTTSNVQFGEGGAGTFSDGKLNTLVKDKDGRGKEALRIFVEAGAPEDIQYESKPHIGTDILTGVVKQIRQDIISHGGEVHFETQVTGLLLAENEERRICGVHTSKGDFLSDTVVLAIGHSARDTFEQLLKQQVHMEPKAFAVGLRVEHPQKTINLSQYGMEDPESLPPSPYKVAVTTSSGRGVYSFCMCPGGYVVNASSENGRLAVNGMSYHARNSHNANSAIIVSVTPQDFGSDEPLAGVEFQRKLEEKAYQIGQGNVPVEYYEDFRKGHNEGKRDGWNTPCIKGRYVFADVHELLPDFLKSALIEGMAHFGHMIHGFDAPDTLMDGIESRTSSPVRITRGDDFESVNTSGLYPCGEGAGYAGGIMSAAMDGIRVAEIIAEKYRPGTGMPGGRE
ncbi:MAG: NAD(P)-binding protein [Butyrivibrio sp.]|jgi:uncharacterized FAD-dependent dehydrogenase|nr:NAD(P)-binding protein [Butyrivibrio sp.]